MRLQCHQWCINLWTICTHSPPPNDIYATCRCRQRDGERERKTFPDYIPPVNALTVMQPAIM